MGNALQVVGGLLQMFAYAVVRALRDFDVPPGASPATDPLLGVAQLGGGF